MAALLIESINYLSCDVLIHSKFSSSLGKKLKKWKSEKKGKKVTFFVKLTMVTQRGILGKNEKKQDEKKSEKKKSKEKNKSLKEKKNQSRRKETE